MQLKKYVILLAISFSNFGILAQTEKTDTVSVTRDSVESVPLNVITPPSGFIASDFFHGYFHAETSCTMLLKSVEEANYLTLNEGMTEKFFLENKMTFIEKTEFISDTGTSGIWYKIGFKIDEMDFIRLMVFAGDLNSTLWINATYPKKNGILLEKLLVKSFNTIQYPLEN